MTTIVFVIFPKKRRLIMKKSLITVLGLVCLAGTMSVQAAGDAAAGKARSAGCMACHGPGGNSLNPMWPKLSGQHPNYLKNQLAAFKSGARKDPVMAPMALPLDDKAMEDLAAYFVTEKRSAGLPTDPKKSEKGMKIYHEGIPAKGVLACNSCHGLDGYGNPGADFPNIAAQHALYVEKALKDYRSKARTTDPGGLMQAVAAKMTDAEISAVAQYVQGLKP